MKQFACATRDYLPTWDNVVLPALVPSCTKRSTTNLSTKRLSWHASAKSGIPLTRILSKDLRLSELIATKTIYFLISSFLFCYYRSAKSNSIRSWDLSNPGRSKAPMWLAEESESVTRVSSSSQLCSRRWTMI